MINASKILEVFNDYIEYTQEKIHEANRNLISGDDESKIENTTLLHDVLISKNVAMYLKEQISEELLKGEIENA